MRCLGGPLLRYNNSGYCSPRTFIYCQGEVSSSAKACDSNLTFDLIQIYNYPQPSVEIRNNIQKATLFTKCQDVWDSR